MNSLIIFLFETVITILNRTVLNSLNTAFLSHIWSISLFKLSIAVKLEGFRKTLVSNFDLFNSCSDCSAPGIYLSNQHHTELSDEALKIHCANSTEFTTRKYLKKNNNNPLISKIRLVVLSFSPVP